MNDSVPSHQPDTAPRVTEVDPHGETAFALFGHDLRSALSDVVGGLRLVDPKALDATTRVQIDRVRASAEVLVRLLDQGLGEMLGEAPAVQPARLDLQRFLTDLDLRWSGRALEKGVTFSMRKAPDLPAALQLDCVAFDRVLSNLLGNAFKYSHRGQVVCDITTGMGGGLRVMVRDDGPGFPAGILDKTRPLQTPPEGMTKPGSGMGLIIADDLTRRLGGRLTLRNLASSGAEAQVDLPQSVSLNHETEPEDLQSLLVGKRVLIADDNPTSQAISARFATGLGAEVVVVNDGTDALGRVEREAFDLLILDMQMPRMTGLEVIRCLRRFPGDIARLPVIAVTAYGLPADRRAILAAGANDVLTKPLLCPQAFAFAVRGALMSQTHPVVAVPNPASVATPPPAPAHLTVALDQDRLHRLLDMAGPETGRDLLDRLIADLGGVQHGLIQACRNPDWEAIRSHSHVLISLAGAVGGLQLQAEAEALNLIGHQMDRAAMEGLVSTSLTHLDALIEVIRQVRQSHAVQTG